MSAGGGAQESQEVGRRIKQRNEICEVATMIKSMMGLHFVAYEHLAVTQHSRWNDQTFSLAELNRLPHAFRQVLLDAERDGAWVQLMLNILDHSPPGWRNDLQELSISHLLCRRGLLFPRSFGRGLGWITLGCGPMILRMARSNC